MEMQSLIRPSFNTLALSALLVSVVTLLWIWMTSLGAIITFSLLFGLTSSGLLPLGSAVVAQITPDMRYIGFRIGFMMALSSIGALGGGPSAAVLHSATKSWAHVQILTSAISFVGGALI
jgi:MFS family permease